MITDTQEKIKCEFADSSVFFRRDLWYNNRKAAAALENPISGQTAGAKAARDPGKPGFTGVMAASAGPGVGPRGRGASGGVCRVAEERKCQ